MLGQDVGLGLPGLVQHIDVEELGVIRVFLMQFLENFQAGVAAGIHHVVFCAGAAGDGKRLFQSRGAYAFLYLFVFFIGDGPGIMVVQVDFGDWHDHGSGLHRIAGWHLFAFSEMSGGQPVPQFGRRGLFAHALSSLVGSAISIPRFLISRCMVSSADRVGPLRDVSMRWTGICIEAAFR